MVPDAQPAIAMNKNIIPIAYSGFLRSWIPSQKIKRIPLKHIETPINALILNFCKPIATLPKKMSIGEQALIKDVKLLVTVSSATVVIPLATTSINNDVIS